MRISDWSSDVCSSDLQRIDALGAILADDAFAAVLAGAAIGKIDKATCEIHATHAQRALVIVKIEHRIHRVIKVDKAAAEIGACGIAEPGPMSSEERRVGKEGVRTCTSRWATSQ